jgi:hypothetical protein
MIDPKVLGLTIKFPPERKEVAAMPAPIAAEKPAIKVPKQALEQLAQNYAAQGVEPPAAVTPAAIPVPATPLTIKLPPVEPVATPAEPVTPFEGFETIALRNAALGYRVFPVDNLKKKASIKRFPELATSDNLELIKHWAEKFPNASCGLLATPEGHLFIDEDDSETFRKGYEAFAGEPYPVSRTTESRSNHRQSHWIQTDYTRAKLKNITQDKTKNSMFSLRFRNYLVLGEGSLHPSGNLYRVVVDSPAIEMPDKLADYILSLLVEKPQAPATAQKLASAVPFQGNAGHGEVPPQFDYIHNESGRNNGVSQYAWWVYTNKPLKVLAPWVHEYNETHCVPPLEKAEVDSIIKGKLDKPITSGANSILINGVPSSEVFASAAVDKTSAKAEVIEDLKATSLLIFGTTPEAELATSLGYHALVASEFKPPLDPSFNRAVIFSNGKDELSQNIYASIPGLGAIYSRMPRKFAGDLASISADEAAAFLNSLMNLDGGIALRSVNARRTKHVEVPADSEITVRPTSGVSESNIPPFDTSVMESNIFGEFVHLATDGTTLCPQYSYQLARLVFAAVLTGRVQYDLVADATPLRRLVLIGETGSGKGLSFARARSIITLNGTRYDRDIKITNSIDSGAGLRDMFWDAPIGLPILVYIDEVMSLGHKSSDKKNPDILDTIGELADSTCVSRVLAKGRTAKGNASKTLNDAYLTTVMCAQDGMAFMCATAGRKTAGFNDRQIPVFSVPVEAGALPIISTPAIVEWWTKVHQILANAGTKENPGVVAMSPEAVEMVEAFWNTQPAAIRTKVRFKKYLQQDAYLNAVAHGRMLVSTDDVADAIKDCKRELATRDVCFQEEAGDRVGYYYAAMKRLTHEMGERIRKAGAKVDPFENAMSEKDFEHETRAQANNEPEPFARAWRHWMPKHLEVLPKRTTRNGREVIRYVPARSERD